MSVYLTVYLPHLSTKTLATVTLLRRCYQPVIKALNTSGNDVITLRYSLLRYSCETDRPLQPITSTAVALTPCYLPHLTFTSVIGKFRKILCRVEDEGEGLV